MPTFKEFMERKGLAQLSDRVETAVTDLVVSGAAPDLGHDQALRIRQNASEVFNDEDFMRRLSEALPKPTDVASEDAFVDEAKRIVRDLLCKRFGIRGS